MWRKMSAVYTHSTPSIHTQYTHVICIYTQYIHTQYIHNMYKIHTQYIHNSSHTHLHTNGPIILTMNWKGIITKILKYNFIASPPPLSPNCRGKFWRTGLAVCVTTKQNFWKSVFSFLLFPLVCAQQAFILFMSGVLDRGIGNDPHHGGRVPSPKLSHPLLLHRVYEEQNRPSEGKLSVGNCKDITENYSLSILSF